MAEGAQELFVKDNTSGEYKAYTPPSFRDSLPEDIRSNEAFKDVNDPATLAKTYLDARGKIPVIPGSPDEYEVKVPESMTLSDHDKATFGEFKKFAHSIGLTKDQAAKLADWNFKLNDQTLQESIKSRETETKAAEDALKKEWGDKYEANIGLAERAVSAFGGDELIKTLEGLKLTRNPVVIKLFHTIATKIGEDNLVTGDRKPQKGPVGSDGKPRLRFNKSFDKK